MGGCFKSCFIIQQIMKSLIASLKCNYLLRDRIMNIACQKSRVIPCSVISAQMAEQTASLCQETCFKVQYSCGQQHYRGFHRLAPAEKLCFASEKLITHVY
jgi:hypothetical protein